jgi:DNA-binding PadR family transcriptional regulator
MSISTKKGNLSPEFAVLGLFYGGPMHGYDLHRKLVTDLGYVWHLSQSESYAILKRLEQRGYLSSQPIPQEKLPPRQLLEITPAGRNHFIEWLQTPSRGSVRAIRMEFLTRLYFVHLHEPENIDGLFTAQRSETEKDIQRLMAIWQGLPVEQIFNKMSLEMRIRQLKLVLSWLEDARQSFGSPNATNPSASQGASK